MRKFVIEDGKAGFALDGNNLVSLFKHPTEGPRKVTYSALALGVQEGGRRLEGHDTVVRDISLQVTAKDLSISQTWLSFVTVQRDGEQIVPVPKEAAHPFPVIGVRSKQYSLVRPS